MGKNTVDIALALHAMEAIFDNRADTFCLVTSDSDFAYLCRKLRERGATACIIGEAKTSHLNSRIEELLPHRWQLQS